MTLSQLILILIVIAILTAIEGLSLGFYIKMGPSKEASDETIELYNSLDWNPTLLELQFFVISMVSLNKTQFLINKMYFKLATDCIIIVKYFCI